MPRIRLLPDGLVNRIAAGEVVERPAACVKELVENALDAGATRVTVSLAAGGTERIEVTDNGAGMDPDDLPLAVQRHCTSKLGDDALVRITTLGFRGEALPSIGACARLHITTRAAGAAHACSIRVEGGLSTPVEPAPGPPGTRVVVSDLFWATPARRKFLKSPRTEGEHAEAAVRRLALSAPHVAIRLELDGAAAFDLPAQDRAARVAALLGPDAAALLLPVEDQRGALHLSGYACGPAVHRATGAGQGLVVNNRPVADPVLKVALRVAYRDVLQAGRFPVAALYLQIPPEDVDVNVHPAKTELRFRDPAAVRALVIGAVARALSRGLSGGLPGGATAPRPALHLVSSRPPRRAAGFAEASLPFDAAPAVRAVPEPVAEPSHPLGAAVAQVGDTYILAVAADGALVLVDQHAAHERLVLEALCAQHAEGRIRAQPLLLPAVVDLPPHDAARLLRHAPTLAALGLDLEGFGAGAVLVRALPAALGAPDPAPLLRDLADELAELGEATALHARLDAVLARLACHGSIRAGRRLHPPEMDALLRRLEHTPRAATCPHGRPTVLRLDRADLERMFGRR